jgi:hypothetical protein
MAGDASIKFSDLPMLTNLDEVREVHRTDWQYFVKRGGSAHAEMTCTHLEDTNLIDNPAWRVATSDQVRALKVAWCESCA